MPVPHPIPLINVFSFYLEPHNDLLLGSAKLHMQAVIWAPSGCWWKRFAGALGSQSVPECVCALSWDKYRVKCTNTSTTERSVNWLISSHVSNGLKHTHRVSLSCFLTFAKSLS